MIVTDRDFEFERPDWYGDSSIPFELKQELLEMGLGKESSYIGQSPVGSTCFACGKKLSLPCIMWNGSHPNGTNEWFRLWLHQGCAAWLGTKLIEDALKST